MTCKILHLDKKNSADHHPLTSPGGSMQKPTKPLAHTPRLHDTMLSRLSTYAVAATAAGVGILSPSAEAKVVYTPANTQILGFVPLDLNNDGTTDFFLIRSGNSRGRSDSGWLSASPLNTNNRVLGQGTVQFFRQNPTVAFSLPAGFEVGPKTKGFHPGGAKFMGGYFFWFSTGGAGSHGFAGPWANNGAGVTDRYLGLAFKVNGLTHFGWARLSVTNGAALTTTLTGYAYETAPNTPIIAGKTHSDAAVPEASLVPPTVPDQVDTQALPMLGALALGSNGIAIWRREEPTLSSPSNAAKS
jgi:hypothetical protein